MSWASFAAYLALATLLFSAVDALARPRANKLPFFPQSLVFLLSIGTPATLAFALGSFAGPIDEAMDEKICLTAGASEEDTLAAESDDTFDLTPDCKVRG